MEIKLRTDPLSVTRNSPYAEAQRTRACMCALFLCRKSAIAVADDDVAGFAPKSLDRLLTRAAPKQSRDRQGAV